MFLEDGRQTYFSAIQMKGVDTEGEKLAELHLKVLKIRILEGNKQNNEAFSMGSILNKGRKQLYVQ